MQYIGIDLAWGEGTVDKPANESGVVAIDDQGRVTAAGWTRGIDETVAWVLAIAEPGCVVAVDAPLVITNASGNRRAESEVATGYGRWHVSANSSNTAMGWQAGVTLRTRLEAEGFFYVDGTSPAPADGRSMFECYPYTTIVGMWELGYETERPRYKRLIPSMPAPEARALRATECDDLIRRVAALVVAETPLDLSTQAATALLLDRPSPVEQVPYKHREDLLDAALCAWTAAIWHQHPERTQVLGATAEPDADGRRPTIIAPARPEQRVGGRSASSRTETPSAATPATAPAATLDSALSAVRDLQKLATTLTARLRSLETELTELRGGTERPARENGRENGRERRGKRGTGSRAGDAPSTSGRPGPQDAGRAPQPAPDRGPSPADVVRASPAQPPVEASAGAAVEPAAAPTPAPVADLTPTA